MIVSVTGKQRMRYDELLCMKRFTHWNNLFPIDFHTVLNYLSDVRELYNLGLELKIIHTAEDDIEADYG